MKTKDLVILICVASSIMLLIAILPLPIGYYKLLRFIISVGCAILVFIDYQRRQGLGAFAVVFAVILLLFNPLIPVYLNKEIWQMIDAFAIVLFIIYIIIIRKAD